MRPVRKIAVVGAGTMGGGIAISAIAAGFPVELIDSSPDMLDRAHARAQTYLARQVEKERMDQTSADTTLASLAVSPDAKSASEADLVIEAIYEDLGAKKSIFQSLEEVVSGDCILATNTSALKVGDIAGALRHPERLCGTHYFSPAEINPVVEVIRAATTAPDVIEAVLPFLTRCRKVPVRCKDQTGFALNRFFCPYTNEAARCLDDGLGTPAQIDAVARVTFGVPLGPFAVMNIVKPRINLAAIRSLSSLGSFYAPALSMVQCGDADESWDINASDPPLDAATQTIVAERLKQAVFHAVGEVLAEGIASASDIDLGARKAFAFAKGPNEMMQLDG